MSGWRDVASRRLSCNGSLVGPVLVYTIPANKFKNQEPSTNILLPIRCSDEAPFTWPVLTKGKKGDIKLSYLTEDSQELKEVLAWSGAKEALQLSAETYLYNVKERTKILRSSTESIMNFLLQHNDAFSTGVLMTHLARCDPTRLMHSIRAREREITAYPDSDESMVLRLLSKQPDLIHQIRTMEDPSILINTAWNHLYYSGDRRL